MAVKKHTKKTLRAFIFALSAAIIFGATSFSHSLTALSAFDIAPEIKSAILIEASTGTVLFERNADEKLPPASVTKLMTMLLIMEAIDGGRLSFDDKVMVSENASGMGGSQIFLETGEQITVDELLKGLCVASGNDAAMAFAEHLGGNSGAFVDMMNARAAELSMTNTCFMNPHGLDESNHYTTARDIAIMSREILKHEKILDYTSIWTDSIRGGKTALANTNKLVRFYDGCDGLKTGSTSISKFCLSATASRGGMRLIAVVMAAPTADIRFAACRQLMDYGFAAYALAGSEPQKIAAIPVKGGITMSVSASSKGAKTVIPKSAESKLRVEKELAEFLEAPVAPGQTVGYIRVYSGDTLISEDAVITDAGVARVSFGDIFGRILRRIFMHAG